MEEQEFILLIVNCKKYAKKALFQKKTWLPLLPKYIKYFHIIGNAKLKEDFYFDNENNILWVKTPDDYNNLPEKVYTAYKAIHETYNYKYIFKTDDDQVLVNNKFFDTITSLIKTKTPQTHYGGYVVDVKIPHYSKYNKIHPELPDNLLINATKYCSGRFYFLSKDAIIDLLEKKQKIFGEYLEDYAIGYHLDNKYKEDILNISTNKFFTDIELSDYPEWIKSGKL
jgi:hypothetical protein